MNNQKAYKRVLFDLNHPADFHFFKHLWKGLRREGYQIKVVARDKECLHMLLDDAGIPYYSRGKGRHSLAGKYSYAFLILLRILILVIRFRPIWTMSLSSPYLALISRMLRITCITFDDTDQNPRLLPLIKRSSYIFSPASYPHHFHSGHFRIPVFKELAYLHPGYFQLKRRESQVFFRITRSDSIHHSQDSIMDLERLGTEISNVSLKHKVILSSEISDLDISPDIHLADPGGIHKDLSACQVFWGNSATMAAEAAVMGIPSIFVGAEKFSYVTELENYGILFHYLPGHLDQSVKKLNSLLEGNPDTDHFMKLRQKLLSEKIDMTSFLLWFVETLPESVRILKETPDYVNRFIHVKT